MMQQDIILRDEPVVLLLFSCYFLVPYTSSPN